MTYTSRQALEIARDARGMCFWGQVSAVVSPVQFRIAGLAAMGDGFFAYDYMALVIKKADGTVTAPKSDTRTIVGYTSTGALFTIPSAFSAGISVGDEILILEGDIEILEQHAHSVGFVRPSGAGAITLTSGGGAWLLGAFSADIIAALDPLLSLHEHDIHWYEISEESANVEYEVVLYGTLAGVADTEVDRIKFTRSNATTRSSEQSAHMPRLDAGSRLRAKMMDSAGGNTAKISVHGHPYT